MPNQQPNLEEQFNQTSQPAIPSLKPKFNLKYILIVLILAVLVGGGIFTYTKYVYKQIPEVEKLVISDETANWQTYRNEKYGFEFKYPKEWELYDHGQLIKLFPNKPAQMSDEKAIGLSELWPTFNIEIYENEDNLNLKEYFDKLILPTLRKDIDHEIQETKINNIDAITFTELGMYQTRDYVMTHNNEVIDIFFTDEKEIVRTITNISFGQIISTFKFTK